MRADQIDQKHFVLADVLMRGQWELASLELADEVPLRAVYRHDEVVEHLAFGCHENPYREDLKECPARALHSSVHNLDLMLVSCSNLIVRDLDQLVAKAVV